MKAILLVGGLLLVMVGTMVVLFYSLQGRPKLIASRSTFEDEVVIDWHGAIHARDAEIQIEAEKIWNDKTKGKSWQRRATLLSPVEIFHDTPTDHMVICNFKVTDVNHLELYDYRKTTVEFKELVGAALDKWRSSATLPN